MVAVLGVSLPSVAFSADPVTECIGASERSLALQKQGRLLDARHELTGCANSTCPEVVQNSCRTREAEIGAAIPTVVFDVKDGAGQPIVGVQVSVDGGPATPGTGTAVAMDPGAHTVRVDVPGQSPVLKSVVVLEGEKEKRVSILVGSAAPEAPGRGRLVVSTDAAATVTIDGQILAHGRFDGALAAGPHAVQVNEAGKMPFKSQVEVREGETRTLSIELEDEKRGTAVWPWLVGGAVVAAGAAVGGYFLFRPHDQTLPVPPGRVASVQLALGTGR
jgi:hypothetical protein